MTIGEGKRERERGGGRERDKTRASISGFAAGTLQLSSAPGKAHDIYGNLITDSRKRIKTRQDCTDVSLNDFFSGTLKNEGGER